jgi:hypothetical protein
MRFIDRSRYVARGVAILGWTVLLLGCGARGCSNDDTIHVSVVCDPLEAEVGDTITMYVTWSGSFHAICGADVIGGTGAIVFLDQDALDPTFTATAPGVVELRYSCSDEGQGDEDSCEVHIREKDTGETGTPLIDLTGTWLFKWTHLEAYGACSEDVGGTAADMVSITHDLQTNGLVLVDLDEGWTQEGGVDGWKVEYAGDISEDGGVTTTETILTIEDPDRMSGTESWFYSYKGQVRCPDGVSEVVATR